MKKINIVKFLFYFAYTLLIIYYLCGQVKFIIPFRHYIYTIIPIILFLIFIIQSKKYSIKSIIICISSFAIFLISKRVSDDSNLFLTLLFIIVSKNINIKEFLKYDLYNKIIISLIIILLYFIGQANPIIKYRPDGTIRSALGFGHPNALGAVIFFIVVDIICLYYKKMKPINYIIIILLLLVSMFVCDSRASQLGIIIVLLLSIIFPLIEKKNIFLKIIPFLPVLVFGFVFLAVSLYSKNYEFINYINELFSSRIRLASEFYEYYGIHFFGNFFIKNEVWISRYYLHVLDISYMTLLIKYGIIPTIISLLSYSLAIKKSISEKKFEITIAFIVFLFYGLMENYIYMIGYNAILIYIGNLIYERKTSKNKKKYINFP